jgi:hypothetical protein
LQHPVARVGYLFRSHFASLRLIAAWFEPPAIISQMEAAGAAASGVLPFFASGDDAHVRTPSRYQVFAVV